MEKCAFYHKKNILIDPSFFITITQRLPFSHSNNDRIVMIRQTRQTQMTAVSEVNFTQPRVNCAEHFKLNIFVHADAC